MWLIARDAGPDDRLDGLAWFGLAFVFLFLSVDEISTIHRNLWVIMPKRPLWLLLYAPVLAVAVGLGLRFLWRLPRDSAGLFVLAGVLYLIAVLGLEAAGTGYAKSLVSAQPAPVPAWQENAAETGSSGSGSRVIARPPVGGPDLTYDLLITLEESLEMAAMILFFWALARHAVVHGGAVGMIFRTGPPAPTRGLGLHGRDLTMILAAAGLAVLAGHLAAHVADYGFGRGDLKGLSRWLNMDDELSLPAWFNSMLIFANGCLLGLIAWDSRRRGGGNTSYWAVLAVIFVFLSLDELTAVHEEMSLLVPESMKSRGLIGEIRWTWVVVYVPIVALIGLAYLRFLWRIPRGSAFLFVLSGSLYVLATVGIDVIGGRYKDLIDAGQGSPLVYDMIATVEETLEIGAMTLFFWSLVRHATRHCDLCGILFRD